MDVPAVPGSHVPGASASAPVSVVLAEDSPAMRLALEALLAAEPTLDLLAAGSDADEAIELVVRHRPAVCLVDVEMPGGGGPRAASIIRQRSPGTAVLALSGREDRRSVVDMLGAGACGYLVKGSDAASLVEAVHAAAAGRRPLSDRLAETVVDELADRIDRAEAPARRLERQRRRVEDVLEHNRLSMVFQPIVELGERRVAAVEALARFAAEPVRSPDVWFGEAAAVGRLAELELAAVRLALGHLGTLAADCLLAVNLSPSTAGDDALLALIASSEPERVIIEITEHAPIADYETFRRRVAPLRELGARLAVDDAGAGFASLRHILELEPDIIKIDMTLTRNIVSRKAERALTRALISFASEMGAAIVAEGIESAAEIEALRDLGVVYGQGYHLARPAPAGEQRVSVV